jgi:hypothetical protein
MTGDIRKATQKPLSDNMTNLSLVSRRCTVDYGKHMLGTARIWTNPEVIRSRMTSSPH